MNFNNFMSQTVDIDYYEQILLNAYNNFRIKIELGTGHSILLPKR